MVETLNNYSDDDKHLPLHLLDQNMVHDKIKHWILRDLNYDRDLMIIITLFAKNSLSGKVINLTSISNCKKMVYQDLIQIMEEKTIDIIFEEFEQHRKEHQKEIQSKSAPEIAYIMFNYPLNRLLQAILRDKIDGQVFIEKYQSGDKWIKKQTGWSNKIFAFSAVFVKFKLSAQTRFKH